MRSSVAVTNFQKRPTLSMCTRSLGVCGERMVGPKLTKSMCGRKVPMMPHSKPACTTFTSFSTPKRSR